MTKGEATVSIVVAVLPAVVHEVGGALRERAARNAPCVHGKPGGRLCAPCAEPKEAK